MSSQSDDEGGNETDDEDEREMYEALKRGRTRKPPSTAPPTVGVTPVNALWMPTVRRVVHSMSPASAWSPQVVARVFASPHARRIVIAPMA